LRFRSGLAGGIKTLWPNSLRDGAGNAHSFAGNFHEGSGKAAVRKSDGHSRRNSAAKAPAPPRRSQPYTIDFERNEVIECGAMLLALIAYPEDDANETRRCNSFGSLCAFALRARYENTAEENVPQSMKPIYAFRSETTVEREVKALQRLLRDRMVAAKMAIVCLKALVQGSDFEPPKGLKRLSLNQLSEFVLTDAGQQDAGNVETRIWRRSRPVVHLAAATAVVIDQLERAGRKIDFRHFLTERSIVEAVVRHAKEYEPLVAACPQLRVSGDELVQVRLARD
jgi:hypothetical protein